MCSFNKILGKNLKCPRALFDPLRILFSCLLLLVTFKWHFGGFPRGATGCCVFISFGFINNNYRKTRHEQKKQILKFSQPYYRKRMYKLGLFVLMVVGCLSWSWLSVKASRPSQLTLSTTPPYLYLQLIAGDLRNKECAVKFQIYDSKNL